MYQDKETTENSFHVSVREISSGHMRCKYFKNLFVHAYNCQILDYINHIIKRRYIIIAVTIIKNQCQLFYIAQNHTMVCMYMKVFEACVESIKI